MQEESFRLPGFWREDFTNWSPEEHGQYHREDEQKRNFDIQYSGRRVSHYLYNQWPFCSCFNALNESFVNGLRVIQVPGNKSGAFMFCGTLLILNGVSKSK